MPNEIIDLPESTEPGNLGILHLKRYWAKTQLKKTGKLPPDALKKEWNLDITLLSVLGLGIEQTGRYLYLHAPDFSDFENWILELNQGRLPLNKINEFNTCITTGYSTREKPDRDQFVLSETDIEFWKENGYVIVRGVISREDCQDAVEAICKFIDVKPEDSSTWYNSHPGRQGIMVQLFQHPAMDKNRQSLKIRAAYEQLWDRKDLWVTTDRAGFNPPETKAWPFQGPRLHWDVSLELPIPFGLQGILYLTDTATNQGAFTLVPGFQNRIGGWLKSLPAHVNPRNEDLYALGSIPLAANAGDFIIWHQALPHGSSPNSSSLPRIVQYINYAPLDVEIRDKWI